MNVEFLTFVCFNLTCHALANNQTDHMIMSSHEKHSNKIEKQINKYNIPDYLNFIEFMNFEHLRIFQNKCELN